MKILRKRFSDKKFLKLIYSGLKAGILDNFKFQDSFVGVPQGRIANPIILHMHEYDKYVINDNPQIH